MVILKQSGGPGCVQTLAPRAATEIVGFLPGGGSGDVTDDRTPIEEMTRRMLLESKKHEKT